MDVMSLFDDLRATMEVERPFKDVEIKLNGNAHVLRVTQMLGVEWAAETDKFPARPGVQIDSYYGYNLRALVRGVGFKCTQYGSKDGWVGFKVDPADPAAPLVPERSSEWEELLTALTGAYVQRLGDAMFGLNETIPDEVVKALKKARAGSEKRSS